MLRILHTSDWHLGHQLHGLPRDREHAAFLGWLLDTLESQSIDALLVAGDIFETANPPVAALKTWYGFLSQARARLPMLDIVVIGGNHDSAARLDAPAPVLSPFGVHVVGGLPRTGAKNLDFQRMVIPLHDAEGHTQAWVAAVPYLRKADLPRPQQPQVEGHDALLDGVRAVYDQVVGEARARAGDDKALIAMGHCYMSGSTLSELSERRILGGNQHALPADLFPDDITYVALGHLHKAQQVGRPSIRYSGSPIPLSMAEADYKHQVVVAQFDGPTLAHWEAVTIPRTVEILRIPARGHVPKAEVLDALRALPARGADTPHDALPFLEVRVRLDTPDPGLQRELHDVLEDRAARLVRIDAPSTGTGKALGDASAGRDLRDVDVQEVFLLKWSRQFAEPPTAGVLADLDELVDTVHQQAGT
jgi:DNA repair protein SbcD/Mre11